MISTPVHFCKQLTNQVGIGQVYKIQQLNMYDTRCLHTLWRICDKFCNCDINHNMWNHECHFEACLTESSDCVIYILHFYLTEWPGHLINILTINIQITCGHQLSNAFQIFTLPCFFINKPVFHEQILRSWKNKYI